LQKISRRNKEREEAEEQAEREKAEAEKKATWERRCKGHYELVAKQQQHPSPFGLAHLPGKYLVQWHSEDYDYFNELDGEDEMKINILPTESPHGVKASFNFGLVEGAMLLAMSKRGVELLRDEQPKHSSDSESGMGESGDDGEGVTFINKDGIATHMGKHTGEKRSLGDIADPFGV
jgi:hypothetical protein